MSSENKINPEIPKYKLIFIGNEKVGKSCILQRFLQDTFIEQYNTTIGLDFNSKGEIIDNQNVHFLLYDTSGQDKFRALIPMYIKDANIIILVYDITSKDSFLGLTDWLKDLTNIKKDEVIFVVVGNKKDLDDKREVKSEEGEKFAKENNFLFAEVSAKTGEGFKELFNQKLFERIRTKFKPGEKSSNEKIDILYKVYLDSDEENYSENNEEEEENDIKKCSLEEHKEIDAISFCQECKVYMCNKCKNTHSGFLKTHHTFDLNQKTTSQFIGICKRNNHFLNLEYFCKTHNILCCVACISKLEGKGNGKHKNCDICFIEDIKNDKQKSFNDNFEKLKEKLKLIEEIIRNNAVKMEKNKEQAKKEIQAIFTKIRNEINKKEDELLLLVDKKFSELFLDKEKIKKNEIKINYIKKNIKDSKINDNDWNEKDKLSLLINNYLNIEKDIISIDNLKKNREEKNKNFNNKKLKINDIKLYKILNSFTESAIVNNDYKILMLGLDLSGKTTILYQMKTGEVKKTIPTIGFNVEDIIIENNSEINKFTIWDVGGHEKIRILWKHYYQEVDGLIFVVDSADINRIGESAEILKEVMKDENLKNCPILIMANKQDLKEALSPIEITEKLGMNNIKERELLINGCSATTGKGIKESLDWLNLAINKNKNN